MAAIEDIVGDERKSFSGRINDGLCEEVINWLPLKDKFKLKSVSNQFKTCLEEVLKTETLLIVDMNSKDRRNYKKLLKAKFHYGFEVDINLMANVLKTMPNIKEIIFDNNVYICNANEVLTTITDNCNHLNRIGIEFNKCSEEVVKRFGQKFGKSLTSIEWLNGFKSMSCLKSFTSLVSLTAYAMNLDQILINNPNITRLNIDDKSITIVSNVTKLEHLRIESRFYAEEDLRLYSDALNSMAMNCKRMKSLEIIICKTYVFNSNQLLKSLQNFSNLRQLRILLLRRIFPIPYELDISCFESCHQLTRLTFKWFLITDRTFDGIETVVPHLKSLEIRSNGEMTDKALLSISKLKNLNSLSLSSRTKDLSSITDLSIISVIDNCIQLKDITIKSKISITSLSLYRMISNAFKYPKMDFKYSLRPLNDIDVKTGMALKDIPNPLPNIEIDFM